MNPIEFQNELTPEERATTLRLAETADTIQPSGPFINKTEARLREAFLAKKENSMKRIQLLWQTLAGVAAVILLALTVNWLVKSLAPEPPAPALPVGNPVATQAPTLPTATTEAPFEYTVVAGDTCFSIAATFNVSVESIVALNNLPTDCSSLFVGQKILILVPTPGPFQPDDAQPASTPDPGGYTRLGTTVYLTANFPQSPTDAGLYGFSEPPMPNLEVARQLAGQFGVSGQVYLDPASFTPVTDGPAYQIKPIPEGVTPDSSYYSSTVAFVVTDGKQRVYANSNGSFSYYADYGSLYEGTPPGLEVARQSIASFLKSHGYDFAYELDSIGGMGPGWYQVRPLVLEGHTLILDYSQIHGLRLQVDARGNVIGADGYFLNLDSQPRGRFGLLSAEQAWEKVIHPDSAYGVLERFHSPEGSYPRQWARTYPDNETLTLHGHISVAPAAGDGQPLITLDTHTLTGNTTGLENVSQDVLIEATGQFTVAENGGRTFQVEKWQYLSQFGPAYLPDSLQGDLRQEGGQVILHSQDQDYVLAGTPADLPLPLTEVYVSGYLMEPDFDWQYIMHIGEASTGGGGGCSGSFAKLNLSGTPVAWPTLVPTPDVTEQRLDGEPGLLNVNIYQRADNSTRTEYIFWVGSNYYVLEGPGLQELKQYHNRPVKIWGAVTSYDQHQAPILAVERFEVPYPDLQFQILTGIQRLITIEGQEVVLFTSDEGKTYAQLLPIGVPDSALLGAVGDTVRLEAYAIPGETLGNYPTLRVFSAGFNPDPGVTADQPFIVQETEPGAGSPPPTLTIDRIELVFYTPDPRYSANNPEDGKDIIQPVWRFSGHYSSGDVLEIFVQALKPEFLLPEPEDINQCG